MLPSWCNAPQHKDISDCRPEVAAESPTKNTVFQGMFRLQLSSTVALRVFQLLAGYFHVASSHVDSKDVILHFLSWADNIENEQKQIFKSQTGI